VLPFLRGYESNPFAKSQQNPIGRARYVSELEHPPSVCFLFIAGKAADFFNYSVIRVNGFKQLG
jgi:hypothetical protein